MSRRIDPRLAADLRNGGPIQKHPRPVKYAVLVDVPDTSDPDHFADVLSVQVGAAGELMLLSGNPDVPNAHGYAPGRWWGYEAAPDTATGSAPDAA